jgi:hypothetical protein
VGERVSAISRDFYFADSKQLTPLQVMDTLGSVTPLLVLFWREASSVKEFAKQSIVGQDTTIILNRGDFIRQKALLGE